MSTPSSTGTSSNDLDGATVTQADNATPSSDAPSATLIQTTTFPPATTSPQAVSSKLPYHSHLNVLYLIPLFVTLGVVLGAITAVILLKWRDNRRRLLRTSTLLSGPPYAPPKSGDQDRLLAHGYPSMEQVTLFAAGTPSKFTIHGSRYIPKRSLTWQSLDGTQPPHLPTIIPSSDGERFTVVTEEDPFVVTSPMVSQQSPKETSDVFLPNIRISPPLPDRSPGDKRDKLKAELPKPFRRSMFDILKLKSYRPTPTVRKEYAVLTRNDEPATTSLPHRIGSLSPLVADYSPLDSGPHVGDKEGMLGLLMLRDQKHDLADAAVVLPKQTFRLKEAPLSSGSSPTRSEKMKKPRKVTPFISKSKQLSKEAEYGEGESIDLGRGDDIEGETPSDIYTRAPRRRRSRTSQRRASIGDASRRSSVPDTHASVLPLSPPSLMSPPLEKTLFFTSPFSSSLSLASRTTFVPIHSSPLRHVGSPELALFPLPTNKTRATKKLRTSRPEPPLPYPPYPDHPRAQTTPRKRSTSLSKQQRSVSSGSPKPKGRSTSTTHRESTSGICSLGSLSPTSLAAALVSPSSSDMLSKVNDIVTLGYTMKRSAAAPSLDGSV